MQSKEALDKIRSIMSNLDEKGRYILIQELADLNRATREVEADYDDDRNPDNW